MGWRFRRIIRYGPFRTTIGKSGLGYSVGIPGLRFGVSPDGRKYISIGIPGTGFYWIKYFNTNTIQPKNPNTQVNTPAPSNKNVPWWKQKNI